METRGVSWIASSASFWQSWTVYRVEKREQTCSSSAPPIAQTCLTLLYSGQDGEDRQLSSSFSSLTLFRSSFDRMLYLGVSSTHAAQLNIIQALTRKFKLHPDLNLEGIAEQCPFHYTGADFYALCADALLKAMSRKAEELEGTIGELSLSFGIE